MQPGQMGRDAPATPEPTDTPVGPKNMAVAMAGRAANRLNAKSRPLMPTLCAFSQTKALLAKSQQQMNHFRFTLVSFI